MGPENLRGVDEYFDIFHENQEEEKETETVREQEEPKCETCSLVSPEEIPEIAKEQPAVQPKEQPAVQPKEQTAASEKPSGPIAAGTVLVLSSDCLGSGDEELGRLLMKGFVYAVTEQDQLPEVVLFYNRGVFLTVEGSGVLEDLKELERRGVKLLSCGTCLNHFGMLDRLKAGEVTNMYELAGHMMKAERLVRP